MQNTVFSTVPESPAYVGKGTVRSVVNFAVQGLSNPEIAARLFMSRGRSRPTSGMLTTSSRSPITELARLAGEER